MLNACNFYVSTVDFWLCFIRKELVGYCLLVAPKYSTMFLHVLPCDYMQNQYYIFEVREMGSAREWLFHVLIMDYFKQSATAA